MKSPDKSAFEAILVVAVILSVAVLPVTVKAEWCGEHQPPPFSEFDQDGDGSISEDEFNATRQARHAAMAEAGKPMKGMATAPSFSDLDTDDDGRLNEVELIAGQQAHMKVMRGQHPEGCGCGCKGKHRGEGPKMPTFADIDSNGDGCISPEEFDEHQASHHRHMHGKKD